MLSRWGSGGSGISSQHVGEDQQTTRVEIEGAAGILNPPPIAGSAET